jgi:molecular chaperone DnaK
MELRGVLESSDVNEIRQKTDALQEASQKLAEVLYAQATASAQASAPGPDGAAAADDEVVEDADFEVVDEEEGATKS